MALDRIEKGMLARFLVLLVDEIGKGYKPLEKKEMQERIYKTGMGMVDGIFSFEKSSPRHDGTNGVNT